MRYFIGFLIVIGLIVLVFVLFATGGSKTPPKTTTSLATYASTATVTKLTIDGPVEADQTHRQVQITVGQDESTIDIVQGYQDTVLNHASYVNNQDSYNVFLHALDLAGFSKKRSTSNTDERGVCPLGDRYIYEIINGATDIQRTWSTSCGGEGTFGGTPSVIITLFRRQIPDYDKLTTNVDIVPQL